MDSLEDLRARDLEQEIRELRAQLAEAQETLRAIREGEVDALVVSTPEGQRVFTLQGADQTYRTIVEQMQEGAVTLVEDGHINYCNRRFAEMVKRPLEQIIGSHFCEHLIEPDRGAPRSTAPPGRRRRPRRVDPPGRDGSVVPVHVGLGLVVLDGAIVDRDGRHRPDGAQAGRGGSWPASSSSGG